MNVRRQFIFDEHSVDRGTQWAVFELGEELRMTAAGWLRPGPGIIPGWAPVAQWIERLTSDQ